jgi:hypothetical protein
MGQAQAHLPSLRLLRAALGLGVILLVLAPVLRFWVTPALAQSPADPGGGAFQTYTTTGPITALFDLGTQEDIAEDATQATKIISVRGDLEGSAAAREQGTNVAVVDTFERMVTEDGRLLHEASMRLAPDRRTQALVDCCDVRVSGVNPAMAGAGSPLRLPWFTPRSTYPYFDPTLLAAVPMAYVGTEEVGRIEALKFQQGTGSAEIGTVQAPGRLVDSEQATVPLTRTYAVTRTLWVDPTTGIVLRSNERIRETLRDDAGRDIITLLALTLDSTPEQEAAQAAQARREGIPVRWAHMYGPVMAMVAGALLLGFGLVGMATRSRARRLQADFPDELATFEDLRDTFQ